MIDSEIKEKNCNITNNITITNSNVKIGCCCGGESNNNNGNDCCDELEAERNRREFLEYLREGGRYHNSVLRHVGNNANPMVVLPRERYAIARRFMNMPDNWNDVSNRIISVGNALQSGQSMANILSEGNIISQESLRIVEKVDSVFAFVRNAINNENRAVNPLEFRDKIQVIIEDIFRTDKVEYNKESDTTNEPGFMVGFCSLAVDSYSFWYDSAINEVDPWNEILGSIDPPLIAAAPPKWLRKVGQALVAVGKDIIGYCDARKDENGVWDSIKEGAGESATAFI